MNNKTIRLMIEKISWSMAPIAWGSFVWFMQWGLGASLIPSYPFNYIFQTIVALGIIIYFFGATFQDRAKKYELQFFEYSMWLPSWWLFMALAILAACLQATPLVHYPFFASLISSVIVASVVEEFVAHSFFIKYKMGTLEFIFFNIISSFAFMYMHTFYVQEGVAFYTLLQNGRFISGFIRGIIAYRAQRIEVPILLHILSNALRLTIPVCLFNCTGPSIIATVFSMIVYVIEVLALAGCAYKEKK